MMRPALMFGLLWAFTPLTLGAPAPRDLHAYWDDRCFSCHGHAGDFARRTLRSLPRNRLSKRKRDRKSVV